MHLVKMILSDCQMHPDVPDLSGSPTAVISWLLSAPKWEVREKGIQGHILYVIRILLV